MKRVWWAFAFLLLASFLFTGCSMLTAEGRQQRAYAKYVRQCSKGRVKQQSRLTRSRMKIPEVTPSEPIVNMDVGGPESATIGDGGM